MKEKRKEASLVSVLDKLFCDRDWQYRLGINRVFLFWKEVVGNEISNIASPEIVKGDVLWLSVPDSMWMQQLHLQKVDLLAKINQRLAEESKNLAGSSKIPALADIRFRIGRTERVESERSTDLKDSDTFVDPQRESDFDMLTRSIKDKELRERIKRLWCGQEKRCVDSK